jgi:hypothetical protein
MLHQDVQQLGYRTYTTHETVTPNRNLPNQPDYKPELPMKIKIRQSQRDTT